jgi:hypothetical protein
LSETHRFPNHVPRNKGVSQDAHTFSLKKNRKKQKTHIYRINLNVAYLIMFYDTVRIRIFIRTFYLVINRSRRADSYFIDEGPQDICMCSVNIY